MFKNYFWTAQFIVGGYAAATSLHLGLEWALLGFVCAAPIALAVAWGRTAYDQRRERRDSQQPH